MEYTTEIIYGIDFVGRNSEARDVTEKKGRVADKRLRISYGQPGLCSSNGRCRQFPKQTRYVSQELGSTISILSCGKARR